MEASFDLVFDLQCFHIIREVNETAAASAIYKALRPGGCAVVVAGAASESEPPLIPGPPVLSEHQLIHPLQCAGLELESLEQSRFNNTAHYSARPQPPLCWVAIFRRPITQSDLNVGSLAPFLSEPIASESYPRVYKHEEC